MEPTGPSAVQIQAECVRNCEAEEGKEGRVVLWVFYLGGVGLVKRAI